jgi:hypothetical protein
VGLVAQTDSGALSGVVTGPEGRPLQGAAVRVSSGGTLYPRLAMATASGSYLVANLPPGDDYTVEVDAVGFNRVKRDGLRIALGTTTTLDVTLARESAPVEVVARPPELSLRQTTLTASVTQREMDQLPLDRIYQSSFLLFPSVLTASMGGDPAVAGATGGENLYLIDGIKVNDPVMGVVGTNLNFNFIREVQGVVGGADADSQASTGGILSVLTRAGTNAFHGDLFVYGTGSAWTARARPTDQAASGPVSFRSYDYGFDLSGPLVKDRAWFFFGINPSVSTRHVEGSYEATYVNFGSTKEGAIVRLPFDNDQIVRNDYWSLKITARPSDRHGLEFSLFGDPSRRYLNEGYAVSVDPAATKTRRYQGGFSGAIKWFANWTPRLFSEVTLARTESRLDLLPWNDDGYGQTQILSYDWSPMVNVGHGMGTTTRDRRATTQVDAQVTWLAGRHEIKAGGNWESMDWENFTAFTGGSWWNVQGGTGPPLSGNPRDYANWYVYSMQNPYSHEKGCTSSLFLQDRWAIRDDLSLTAGLRWERDQVFPEHGEILDLPSISPRLGLAWDFTRTGKGKLFAHWGQYHGRVPIEMAQSMDAGHAYYADYWTDHGQMHLGRQVMGNVPTTVAPGTKSPYDEEWVVGASYQVRPDITVSLTAVFRQLGRVLEDVVYPDAQGNLNAILVNPGSGPWPAQMSGWATQVPDYEPFPRPIRNYQGYTLQVQKRFQDGWFLNGSYTWSRLTGNYEGGSGGFGTDGFAPFISSAYDYPLAIYNRYRYGLLPQDRTHEIKMQTAYQWDSGLSVGALFEFVSGRPVSRTMAFPLQEPGGGVLFASPRGGAGRLPDLWHLDLRAQYAFKLHRTDLSIILDLFNVTNRQEATAVHENFYLAPMTTHDILTGNLRPDPRWGQVTSRQAGRFARLGLKWSF